jgi:acetyl esterase/lipase
VDLPPHLNPFVLTVAALAPERHGNIDLYLPAADEPRPAVVFVHGGPVPAEQRPTPRDWPVFLGYGAAAAVRGVVGVTVDHGLHGFGDYPHAAADVATGIAMARTDPRIDPDRIALWFFSGGSPISADWLRDPPDWLRCIAYTYPLLAPLPGVGMDPRFNPVEAVAGAGTLPIVLTRVGRERPHLAVTVEEFVPAAEAVKAWLEIIDVPDGQHAFDVLDHTDESREAVERALSTVINTLN